jgi:Zn-dependent peptidase ImmA (M78 family)
MPPVSRAVRAARSLLAEANVRRPAVPVDAIAEKYAVLVRETLPNEISGMLVPLPSQSNEAKWAIVVNAADPPVRQRFTVAHELAHLLLHRYTTPHADGRYQVRFRDEASSKGSVREEIEANQFAAELLMPEKFLRLFTDKMRFDLADDVGDADAVARLIKLAKRFEVSVQALSFRLANMSTEVA